MRQNSIDYPGERPARRAEIVEQPGYTGKHYFVVNYAGRQLTVHAADETAALFWAAKRWGYGKTLFLTREEAEKALREMEGKKDGKT